MVSVFLQGFLIIMDRLNTRIVRKRKTITKTEIVSAMDPDGLIATLLPTLKKDVAEEVAEHVAKELHTDPKTGDMTGIAEITIVDKKKLDEMYQWMEDARRIMQGIVDRFDYITSRREGKAFY